LLKKESFWTDQTEINLPAGEAGREGPLSKHLKRPLANLDRPETALGPFSSHLKREMDSAFHRAGTGVGQKGASFKGLASLVEKQQDLSFHGFATKTCFTSIEHHLFVNSGRTYQ
jgi:hypothetical protein